MALGKEEAQLERRVGQQLAQQRLDRLRRRAARPQVLEERLDAPQGVVARAGEAPVDRILHHARRGRKAIATTSVAPAVAHVEPLPNPCQQQRGEPVGGRRAAR